MKIRNATKDDIDDLMELALDLFRVIEDLDKRDKLDYSYWMSKKHRADVAKLVRSKKDCIFVAIDDDDVVGFVQGSIQEFPQFLAIRKKGRIDCLYVKEEYRKGDIATHLLGSIEKWFKSRRIKTFDLRANIHNHGAITFWEKQGYKKHTIELEK